MWTYLDQQLALAEGWGIFDNSDHGLRIERFDDVARFDCDAAAIAYVGMKAIRGDALARKAFEHVAWEQAIMDAVNCDMEV